MNLLDPKNMVFDFSSKESFERNLKNLEIKLELLNQEQEENPVFVQDFFENTLGIPCPDIYRRSMTYNAKGDLASGYGWYKGKFGYISPVYEFKGYEVK